LNSFWKLSNYLIIIVILGVAGYFIVFNPRGGGNEEEDVLKRNVRQNATYPRLVAWLFPNKDLNSRPPALPVTPQPGADTYGPNFQGALQNTPMDNQAEPQTPGNNAEPFPDPAPPGNTGMFAAAPAQAPSVSNVMEKVLQEGHWIGLEVGPLTPALATANGIPLNIKGVLVDEVTLLAASSGLIAGDVISAINNRETADLHAFKDATRPIAMSRQVTVTVYRRGSYRKIEVRGAEELGMAQMEAAPMINATDPSPHGYYGPCEKCHAISKTVKNTGQLAKDGGDVLAVQAPAIKWGAKPIHGNRGTCTSCHKII
jgi:hypothetical protein